MRTMQKIPSMIVCISYLSLLLTGLACRENADDATMSQAESVGVQEGTPTLLDLGSLSCVPCQMMEEELAILDDLTGDLLTVTFIDINQDPDSATEYGIRIIPTQIFLAPDGTVLFRHEGYMSAEQMLSRWITLGYDVYVAEDDTYAS